MIDGMPTLSGGAHSEGTGQACVMEYVSVLMGLPWTDLPECTNKMIARVAQRANDNMSDATRWRVLEFIPRLTATSRVPEGHSSYTLDVALVEKVYRKHKANFHFQPNAERLGMQFSAYHEDGEHIDAQPMFDVISGVMDPLSAEVNDGVEDTEGLLAVLTTILDEYERLAGVVHLGFTDDEYLAATDKVLIKV